MSGALHALPVHDFMTWTWETLPFLVFFLLSCVKFKLKVRFTLEQATKAQWGIRVIAQLFL